MKLGEGGAGEVVRGQWVLVQLEESAPHLSPSP